MSLQPAAAAADPDVAVEAAAGPDVDVVAEAVEPDDDVAAAVPVVVRPDVADHVAVAVAAAAGPDVVVVIVAVAAARAVPLPIACKLSHNSRRQCDEETYYMLGTHGHPSAKPR